MWLPATSGQCEAHCALPWGPLHQEPARGQGLRRVLMPEDAERRRRRWEKRRALVWKPSGTAYYGYNTLLLTAEEATPGYVDPTTFKLVINARWSGTRR
ncbi:hypothetical protein E2562_028848 [Oryza meyeriana var. granulata]|uniref:Uncharacterized protein n=1 Tax=Oryza meyeriana var. granulata TaxID=110450 RepID=A0A6G1FD73_9ORYZ|nr:hypothetical protein E2562_028848 [Oryza meyeriana var. granulata]